MTQEEIKYFYIDYRNDCIESTNVSYFTEINQCDIDTIIARFNNPSRFMPSWWYHDTLVNITLDVINGNNVFNNTVTLIQIK